MRPSLPYTSRRHFMALMTMGIAGIWAGRSDDQIEQHNQPQTNMNSKSHIGYEDDKYILPPLPYAYDALDPLMDEETVKLHHDKHHAAYVAGANAAMETLKKIAKGEVDSSATNATVRNLAFHTAGHALHTMYWTNMAPNPKKEPGGKLAQAIKDEYGSLENFMTAYKAACMGVQGSGWALLSVECLSGKLVINGAEKHENCEIPGMTPILACDVWEHAYYLKHQNNRAGFVENFIKLINWDDVEARYDAAMS